MTLLLDATGLAIPGRLAPTELRIESPGLVCLVGPNGSGKTSLLHALSGIGAPSGAVTICGIDARAAPPAERRRLFAYLPANRDIAWPLSARDVAGLALGRDDAAIDAALATLDLTDFAARRVDRLSTGERSRVLLARALAAQPRLLLLDEPVANLDPLWQLRLMEILKAEARLAGRAVLVALHDLDLAARYADRLIVMKDGRIAADGDPLALVAGPVIPAVFGIERSASGWRPATPPSNR
ncbi:ABC transporter ATP-binding protein [Sphingosinicella sp. BN140058]|uniref:ABC transporter ATP-binding protein n=1 Tax=Sphingosinicella sp. BN140058 TaxID=1892855 RepID=UPI001010341D|nr:ABC transporter ATP-binding protein [Sphingosinicella sp. BN140058]QAY79388.1 ABC transporter ATP-binding protein [Sphingosinicella sp. BN140058]